MSHLPFLPYIEQFGYAALFFALWLGMISLPIPNEAIVVAGGAAAGTGLLAPLPALACAALGVASGLTFSYYMGRIAGPAVLGRFARHGRRAKYAAAASGMIARHGSLALCFSYFLPVVRHLLPFTAGASRMPYRRFALFAYPAGALWTCLCFASGLALGGQAGRIAGFAQRHGPQALWLAFALTASYVIIRRGMPAHE
ncbi:DedA family protein [Cohnella rhizosphaerae]|uniref:VTT domain-containing protein n=1 Tax=Cohnella rhizosphaerae TaxID=1457232 RepID=A0A9X4QT60_9BACL|nr:VTT domain-containing protein [Cohnella rhizosphaerae]MDG0809983.1 VTT domain-containing protein [Cohnella rhizosphaerae]